jgi:hypothetical protein
VEALERRDLPSTSGERFLAAVYPALLGRELDPAGLAVWGSLLDEGLSPVQVVRSVENSLECRTRVVQDLYETLLGREADPAGLAGFTALLGSGDTAEQAAAALAGSAEYYAVRGGGSAGGFLTALYRDALGRPPDPAGAAGFAWALAAGVGPGQVAAWVFASPEYRQDLVQGLFRRYLQRTVNGGGLGGFLAAMRQGARSEDVRAAVLGSDEYYTTRVDPRGTPNQQFVARVYPDLLGHAASPAALAVWRAFLDGGGSRAQLVRSFANGAEYRTHVVQDLHERLLGREANAAGLAGFMAFLASGGTAEQVAAALAGSAEYYAVRGGSSAGGFLNALYRDALGRPLDPAGAAGFAGALAAGVGPGQVAAWVFASPEYRSDLVRNLFRRHLQRTVDGGGVAGFLSLLQGGGRDEDVITALLASPEFYKTQVDQAETFAGQSDAVFVNPTPGGATAAINGNVFFWGEPALDSPTGGQSGMVFVGTPFAPQANQTFSLGTLFYVNRTTVLGTEADGVDLVLTVGLTGRLGGDAQSITLPLAINNTLNSDDPIASQDTITLNLSPGPLTLTLADGRQVTLDVLGFGREGDGGLTPVAEIFVQEGQSTAVQLLARFDAPPVPDIAVTGAALDWATGLALFQYAVANDPGPFTVGLYRSADLRFDASDVPVVERTVTPVPNTSAVADFPLPVFTVTDPAHPYWLVVADPSRPDSVKESNEANNEVVASLANALDWGFIGELEGGQRLQGYIPDPASSDSGVTVATGVDLGHRNAADLDRLGLDDDLKQKLLPYLGKTGPRSEEFAQTLVLTQEEADRLDQAVRQAFVPRLLRLYDTATVGPRFDQLPSEAQTVIASVLYLYQSPGKVPLFWGYVTSQDWAAAYNELRDFHDSYQSRHDREANLLANLLTGP